MRHEIFWRTGIKYVLQTFHSIEPTLKKGDKTPYEHLNKFKHIIIDSGLYSIMFGCDKDKPFDEKICNDWKEKYISYINNSKFTNADFVELDVQKKLGVDAAWELRREMKARINKGTMISPYHLEDGNPDKLIDFADYIAVSIPELRFNVSRNELKQITQYISRKATSKNKRVHLLGCTDKKLMKEFNYCTSCDSTSFSSPERYGFLKSELIGTLKADRLVAGKDIAGYTTQNKKISFLSCSLLLADYKKYAGDQN
jgi:hypothetical protein